MNKEMKTEEKDKYIEFLEKELKLLSLNNSENTLTKNCELSLLLDKQEEFLTNYYTEKDSLLADNQRLNQEVAKLTRTIMINNDYINYLLNSFWWKITLPFRMASRRIRKKNIKSNYQYVETITPQKKVSSIKEKVSIIIFTYNAGEEFTIQLKNLNNQKLIDNYEIIVIDKGSSDNTMKYSKEAKAKVISFKNTKLNNNQIYEKCLSDITGEYVVIIDQNKIVDSKYWIYQAIRPIKENKAVSTIFFKKDVNKDISIIKDTTYYYELKQRMSLIANEQVLFFPKNRDIIQYLSPVILDKSCVLVKKKISNMFLI